MKELLRLMGMLGITLSGFRLLIDPGAIIGGGLQGLGTALAGYWSAQQAKEDRKQKKNIFNKETLLNITQGNYDKDRLAGLAGVFSGNAERQTGLNQSRYLSPVNGTGNWDSTNFSNELMNRAVLNNSGSSTDTANLGKWQELSAKGDIAGQRVMAETLTDQWSRDAATAQYKDQGIYKNIDASKYKI